MDFQSIIEITCLTLGVSGTAISLASLVGIPFGAILGMESFRSKRMIEILVFTGMALPPVVVGLVVYLFLSNQGPLNSLDWLFTPQGMVLAQFILALPIATGLTASAIEEVPNDLRQQLKALGANQTQVYTASLWHARRGIIAAVLAAFGRVIAEVGAVMLVGGNISNRTRVLSTAIVLETQQGKFNTALALGAILISVALLANFAVLALGRSWLLNRYSN